MKIMAIAFLIAGMWQIDQRHLLTNLTGMTAQRRLLLATLCMTASVGLVS